ncbi:MAG: rhomboid family intramembrane serine protease [Candidatus Thermoplasmatota archaeon]|nr:rhomboid family intramembrane serine protease [Candidatus Thermoplasmatota archaeon]
MELAWKVALGVGALLVAVHGVATARTGWVLTEEVRHLVGASPGTTLERPWAHLTAPFFHDGLFHLSYNLTVLLITLPVALAAMGPWRGAVLAYLASPVSAILVNLLLILPLAAAGWSYAQVAVDPRLVGASIMIFAGAGMALATRPWSATTVALVAIAFVGYELVLAVTGTTRPFVGVYHVTGAATGFLAAHVLGP